MSKNSNQEKSVSIRFPIGLLTHIKDVAQGNERSLNGEVLIAVREHIQREEAKRKHANEDL